MKLDNIVCLIPTWLTATHALNAYRSFHRYYPHIPVYFVDDERRDKDIIEWKSIYVKGWDSLDEDSTKLIGLPMSCYLRHPHEGTESEGHGNAITYAMKFIHAKWVLHLSSDVRIIENGLLEFLEQYFDDNTVCGIGEGFNTDLGPNLGKWLCFFRGDLYHELNLDFHAERDNRLDAGQPMFKKLTDKGYKIIDIGIHAYYEHLTSRKNETWKYYEI